MKPKPEIDQFIDDHLKDHGSVPTPGFTADVLKQISEDRLTQEPVANVWFPWWFLVPLAATIAIALWLLPNDPSDSKKVVAKGVNTGSTEQYTGESQEVSLTELEEILTMKESLRDFEILFDDDALEILALMDQ